MLASLKRLSLGLLLIAVASAALLFSDLDSRKGSGAGASGPASGSGSPANPSGRKWKIEIIQFNETPPVDDTMAGMDDAWKRSPLKEGRDYVIVRRNAQGDIASLSGVLDAALTDHADIIVTLSTPTLQAAVKRVHGIPLIFTLVTNPIIVGAGKSDTDHLPNVTGIYVPAPAKEIVDVLQKDFPEYRRIGTLFCPAEANSVYMKDMFSSYCQTHGIALDAVAVQTSAELSDAALALAARPIDAIVQIPDNLTSASFAAITQAARRAHKPLLSLNPSAVALGAAFALGRDYRYGGEVTVPIIERVIRGESPASIPFEPPPKLVCYASAANAALLGMTLPQAALDLAAKSGR